MPLHVLQQRSTNPESSFQRWMAVSGTEHPVYAHAMWELVMERMADGQLSIEEWDYRIVEAGKDEH